MYLIYNIVNNIFFISPLKGNPFFTESLCVDLVFDRKGNGWRVFILWPRDCLSFTEVFFSRTSENRDR